MHSTSLAEAVETGFAPMAATLTLASCTADKSGTPRTSSTPAGPKANCLSMGKDVAKVAGCVEGLLSRVAQGRRPALRP